MKRLRIEDSTLTAQPGVGFLGRPENALRNMQADAADRPETTLGWNRVEYVYKPLMNTAHP